MIPSNEVSVPVGGPPRRSLPPGSAKRLFFLRFGFVLETEGQAGRLSAGPLWIGWQRGDD